MSEYRHIANLKGDTGDKGDPGIGSHGVISSPTNIDELREDQHVGSHVARATNLIGGPQSLRGDNALVTIDVMRNANNAVTQYLTTIYEVWWRASLSGTSWASWGKLSKDAVLLSDETDADTYFLPEHDGTYAIRETSLINGPSADTNSVSIWRVTYGGAENAVEQTLQTLYSFFWRRLIQYDEQNPVWGPWNRTISTEDLGDDEIVSSPVVKRIITSTDPDEPLEDGDLLLVIE